MIDHLNGRRWLLLLAGLLALFLPNQEVWAQQYGQPLPTVNKDQLAVGVALANFNRKIRISGFQLSSDNTRETVFVDWGYQENAMFRGEFSTVDLGSSRGSEFAFSYRRSFGEPTEVGDGDMKIKKGFLAGIRKGEVSDQGIEADFLQIDLAAGGVIDIDENKYVYFAAIFSKLDGTITVAGTDFDFEGDSSLGIYGGGTFKLDKSLLIGAEMHFLFGSGFGLFGRLTF
ncbi:MAG: hypothetical protein O6934_02725 [SAR324 cluster bacterium]|nr:hypothetical protein [SAR324 cluster bacterium]